MLKQPIKRINIHKGFGLRKEWLELWLQSPEEWEGSGFLGNRQVESLKAWLKTAGLVDKEGRATPLAQTFREKGTSWLEGWEIIWVNIVFSFPTARWYVKHFHQGEWTIKELQSALHKTLSHYSPRTVYNSLLELVGLLEKTPIGSELGQGKVTSARGRIIERRGLEHPTWTAIKRALILLMEERKEERISMNDPLLMPWSIFGFRSTKHHRPNGPFKRDRN